MSEIRVRFAPSPTGPLHIGGLRTALFNYLFAKKNNGTFLVRIEDTDRERSTKEFEKNILDNLASIGLNPDKIWDINNNFVTLNNNGKKTKIKANPLKYLNKQEKYDLILIKQTIHFFSKTNLNRLLNLAKKRLNTKGKILIFSLKTKNNKIPCFKKMRKNLEKSLKRDEVLFKIIKKNLKKISYTNFNFKVNISKQKYVRMIRERYISCLLNMSNKEIKFGISEIKSKYKNQIKFTDTLKCISYRK